MMIVLSLLISNTGIVHAAGEDDDGIIEAGEVYYDDVFTEGDNVVMSGIINGNYMAGGTNITIDGEINGDALLFGSHIIIEEDAQINGNLFIGSAIAEMNGTVNGSVFGGSSSIILGESADISRNFYYGAYHIESESGSNIDIDLFAGAYQVILAGEVKRDVNIGAAAIELDGHVGRNVTVDVASPADEISPMYFFNTPPGSPPPVRPGIRVSDDAIIDGKLTYTSGIPQEDTIQVSPEEGIVYQTPVPDESYEDPGVMIINENTPRPENGFFAIFFWRALKMVRNFITLSVLGILVIWLLPKLLEKTVNKAQKEPLPSTGVGILVVLGGYLAFGFAAILIFLCGLIFMFITLGSLSSAIWSVGFSSLGLVAIIFGLLVKYGSKIVVAYLVGKLILKQIAPQSLDQKIWPLLLGLALYTFIRVIPIVGWIFSLVVTVIGIGAMWLTFMDWNKSRRSQNNENVSASDPMAKSPAELPEPASEVSKEASSESSEK